ncbi:cbb3-type cytochrome c oxidase subunit 3 [Alkalilacustris brevis]|uniref:cbb3-type cytochrome c oxidase subunit 3 n=1 Tax=Alkalilacustris brevis TaxID=2026338 RepID=UPI000E0D0D97|nr:cbb3-type cytochrome c oxidase subunit 3 [Alkalilacustris brevis]
METYTMLRTFADSWHLLFMFLFFIGVVLFVFRPGSREVHEETSNMIFRNDDRPAREGDDTAAPEGRGQSNEAR